VVKAMIGLLSAIPGTRLYERLKKEGRLLNSPTGDNCDGTLNFIPKTMDIQTVIDGYQKVLDNIYSPREYYGRVMSFLKVYKPTRRRRRSPGDLGAFFRSMLYLGILDKGKFHYWKLLVKVSLFHRKAFGEAITLAIFGYHFRKLIAKS